MTINYKKLQYSWETDPIVKDWKEVCDAQPPCPITYPSRVKVGNEYVVQTGIGKTTKDDLPPDPRTKEQIKNDLLVDRVKVWDRREQKSHVYSIKCIKAELRRQLKRVHQIKNGTYTKGLLVTDLPTALKHLKYHEYLESESVYKIHWTVYVDYVNERFGLNIRKDLFTDKELEKAKVITDVAPVKAIGGVNGL